MSDTSAPTTRIEGLDIARGFALFGVLISNLYYHALGPYLAVRPRAFTQSDLRTYEFIGALFAGKFYPLLSFLFGYGAWLMFDSARRRGANFNITFRRRIFGLALIGFIHGTFVFDGDILFTYALLGLALMLFIGLPTRSLVRFGAALFVFQLLVTFATGGAGIFSGFQTPYAVNDTYAHDIALRFLVTIGQVPSLLIGGWLILAMFFFGAAAASIGLARRDRDDQILRLMRGRVFFAGLIIALPAGFVNHSDLSRVVRELAGIANLIGGPMIAVGIFAWALRFATTTRGRKLRIAFSSVGKLSLSNYLTQSVVMLILLNHIGFGLRDLPLISIVGIALVVYAIELVVSTWYAKRYRLGPAERVLRSITYGQRRSA